MVSAGEMNQADLAGVLQTIAQQQTALLQVHGETVRLQRLLVEHMLGNQAGAAAAIPAPVTEYSQLLQPSIGDVPSPSPAPATPTPVPTETPAPLPPAATSSPTPVAAEPLADAGGARCVTTTDYVPAWVTRCARWRVSRTGAELQCVTRFRHTGHVAACLACNTWSRRSPHWHGS